jgi:hypothetical protein
LRSRLRWTSAVRIDLRIVRADGPAPLSIVKLTGPAFGVTLGVRPGKACLEAAVDGVESTARVVPLGDGSPASLIGEELGVRTRDLAFEEALLSAREISV